jgi:hypothetical protein
MSTTSCSPVQSLCHSDCGTLCANPDQDSIPSAAALGAQYQYMLDNDIIQEFKDKWNALEAQLNIAALEVAAGSAIGSRCTATYKISQVLFRNVHFDSFAKLYFSGGFNQASRLATAKPPGLIVILPRSSF